jgi:REP element-mobilizing transposase RayT
MLTCMNRSHSRRSIRLRDYDYAQNGAYFVTVCAHERASLFGEIVDEAMILNEAGKIAEACWAAIPRHFSNVELDAFVVMPNHIHGIIVIADEVRRQPAAVGAQQCCAPTSPKDGRRINVAPGSLGAIVRSFKSAVTKEINGLRGTPSQPVWQRNYYDHIIRNERELNAIHDYIEKNPQRWALDEENAGR